MAGIFILICAISYLIALDNYNKAPTVNGVKKVGYECNNGVLYDIDGSGYSRTKTVVFGKDSKVVLCEK